MTNKSTKRAQRRGEREREMNDLDVLSEVKKIMDEKNATTFNVIDVQEATKRIKRKEILRILWIVSISVAVSLITVYMM